MLKHFSADEADKQIQIDLKPDMPEYLKSEQTDLYVILSIPEQNKTSKEADNVDRDGELRAEPVCLGSPSVARILLLPPGGMYFAGLLRI